MQTSSNPGLGDWYRRGESNELTSPRKAPTVRGRSTHHSRYGGSGGSSRAVAARCGALHLEVQVHKAFRLCPRVPRAPRVEPVHPQPRVPQRPRRLHREDHHRHPHDARVQPVAPHLGVDIRRHHHLARRRVQRQVPPQPLQEDRCGVHLRVHVGVGGGGAGNPTERPALARCPLSRRAQLAFRLGGASGRVRHRAPARAPQARATEVQCAAAWGYRHETGAVRRRG